MSREQNTNPRIAAEGPLDEAESLIWAMLDEQLDAPQKERLCKMIEEDQGVRALYIDCVQLHVDLSEHYGRAAAKSGGTVVLGNLMTGMPGTQGLPQIAD
jgi:hypothetical protein